MKFLHLHLFHKEVDFGNIEGYDDIKDLVRRALDSDENYNLLLCGPPASAKTLFLYGILECRKVGVSAIISRIVRTCSVCTAKSARRLRKKSKV